MIGDKKKETQRGKTKLIFENLIFPQRNFACWWNLNSNMPDYLNPFMPRSYILQLLNAGLFNYV